MPLLNSMGVLKLMSGSPTVGVLFTNYLDMLSDNLSGTPTSLYTAGRYKITGESIVFGSHQINGADATGFVMSADSYGNIISQKYITAPTTAINSSLSFFGGIVDSTGNSYLVGNYTTVGAGSGESCYIIKLDSTLNIVWQKRLKNASVGSGFYNLLLNTSTNTLYVVGVSDGASGVRYPILAKYDASNGTLISQNITSAASTAIRNYSVSTDSGNYYVSGNAQTSPFGAVLTKFSLTSDAWQWSVRYNTSSAPPITYHVTDSGGNTFISLTHDSGSNVIFYLAKFNSSGTIVWQKKFTQSIVGGSASLSGMTIDASGNVYLQLTNLAGGGLFILKFDTSGTILWQNKIVLSSGNLQEGRTVNDIDWRGGKLFVGTGDALFTPRKAYDFSLPDDGSLTGTYANFTYSTSSLSWVTATQTVTTLLNTSSTLTMIDEAGAATISTGSAYQTVVPL